MTHQREEQMSMACKTMDVPTAGKLYYGLGRNASYELAKTNPELLPTIPVGRLLRVPIVLMDRIIESPPTKE